MADLQPQLQHSSDSPSHSYSALSRHRKQLFTCVRHSHEAIGVAPGVRTSDGVNLWPLRAMSIAVEASAADVPDNRPLSDSIAGLPWPAGYCQSRYERWLRAPADGAERALAQGARGGRSVGLDAGSEDRPPSGDPPRLPHTYTLQARKNLYQYLHYPDTEHFSCDTAISAEISRCPWYSKQAYAGEYVALITGERA